MTATALLWTSFGAGENGEIFPKLAAGKQLTNKEISELRKLFIDAYRHRLAELGYKYSDQDAPSLVNEKNVRMYHLLFFASCFPA